MTLGDRIKSRREELGLTREDLAKRADIEVSYISKLERDKAPNVSASILAKVASALRTDMDHLVKGDTDLEALVQSEIERLARTADAVLTKEELESLKSVMRMILSKKR